MTDTIPSLEEWMDDDVPDLMHDAAGASVPAPQFTVDDLKTLDYALRRISSRRARVEARNAEADAWIARVEAWREHANRGDLAAIERLEGLCEAHHRRELEAAIAAGLPERQWPKTITAPHGVLTSSAGRPSIEVDDEDALRAFLLELKAYDLLKMTPSKTDLKARAVVVDKDDRRVLVLDGALVPGVHVVVGERTFKVKPGGDRG